MPSLIPSGLIAFEIVILSVGCALLWIHGFSPAGRAQIRRAAAGPKWGATPLQFVLFLWLVLSLGVLSQGLISTLTRNLTLSDGGKLILVGGSFHLGMLAGAGAFYWIQRRYGTKAVQTDALKQKGNPVLGGFATVLIALPLIILSSLGWQFLLKTLGYPLQEQDLIGVFAQAKSPVALVLLGGIATVLAPVTEEMVFRGGIFRFMRGRVPHWIALLVPSLLFAALHQNMATFLPLTILGIVFSLAYERTRCLAVPIIAHGLFNLHTIVLICAGIGL